MRRAFTLLEIATVLAIIGLLAAMTIPTYASFTARARVMEATTLLETIAHAELRHQRDRGHALPCPKTPATVPAATAVPFESSGPWQAIGFQLAGPVRYSYRVDVDPDGAWRVVAEGDLDGDGVLSTLTLDGRTLAHTAKDELE